MCTILSGRTHHRSHGRRDTGTDATGQQAHTGRSHRDSA
nr:MAG TPA: hypothetical protein [Caudoviricetes sp.]